MVCIVNYHSHTRVFVYLGIEISIYIHSIKHVLEATQYRGFNIYIYIFRHDITIQYAFSWPSYRFHSKVYTICTYYIWYQNQFPYFQSEQLRSAAIALLYIHSKSTSCFNYMYTLLMLSLCGSGISISKPFPIRSSVNGIANDK